MNQELYKKLKELGVELDEDTLRLVNQALQDVVLTREYKKNKLYFNW